jgi:hypothetical protein
MTDMLVKLYDLPDYFPVRTRLMDQGVDIRQPFPSEKRILIPWIQTNFHEIWAAECAGVLERDPINCFIAIEKQSIPQLDGDPYNLPPEKVFLVRWLCWNRIGVEVLVEGFCWPACMP